MYSEMMRRMQQKDTQQKKKEQKAAVAAAADAEVLSLILASNFLHLLGNTSEN